MLGRSDFGWEEFRTIGEFDGAQKYGRLLLPGQAQGDRIYQEKLREDRIRDAGWQVARWTWDELQDGSTVIVTASSGHSNLVAGSARDPAR